MSLAELLFTAALLMPLVVFLTSMLVRREGANAVSHALFILGGLFGCAGLASLALSGATAVSILPSLRMGLAVQGFAPFFLLLIYAGTILTSLFAIEYLKHYRDTYTAHWLNAATALFIFGMQAVVLSGTAVGFLLAWEIMSLAAYFLVIADRSRESLYAGFMYLVMTHLGFVALMAGFLILSNGDPWASWQDLADMAQTLPPLHLAAAFFLLFAGFGSKAGLVPLHQWLPYAHPQAPSHSSALLSGVMLKVALFGFLLAASLFPYIEWWWAAIVVAIGLLSALFGVVSAAVETDMKRLLAWSSIENMGLIFSALGIVLVLAAFVPTPAAVAIMGSLLLFVTLHALNHMLFKSGLFMTAGAIAAMTHTRDLDDLGGLANKWPAFSGAALLLALGAAALPPLGTFFGEWLYVQTVAGAIGNLPLPFSIAAAIVLTAVALTAGIAIFTFANFFASAFLGRARTEKAEHAGKLPALLWVPPALSAAGLFLVIPFIPVLRGAPLAMQELATLPDASINPLFVLLLAGVVGLLAWSVGRALLGKVRVTETWDCGQPLTRRMEYTATGFSAPIRFFFRSVVLARKAMIAEPVVATNPWIARRRLEWSVASFWEEWVYKPIGNAILYGAMFTKRMQSGIVQVYLLLLVIALVATMIFAL